MNLRALETLVAVADGGSFAAAAERVGVTQSAVSMQIKALEEELGADLFDRTRRPPSPSDLGWRVIDRARDMLRLDGEIRAMAAGTSIRGRLRLGVIPTAATGLVPDALARLAERAPDLRVRIESGLSADLARRVLQGALDAAVVTETSRLERGLVARTILEEPLVVVAPPDSRGTSDRALLRGFPFVRFNRRTGVGRVIDAALRRRRITVSEAMELDSIEAILAMVSRGLGVAVAPVGSVTGPHARPLAEDLVSVQFGSPPVKRAVSLIERARREPDRLSDALFTELKSGATVFS